MFSIFDRQTSPPCRQRTSPKPQALRGQEGEDRQASDDPQRVEGRRRVAAATPATPSAFAQVSRIAIEFEILALQARLTVLEELADATDEEKMECLFVLLDKNLDGALSATEIGASIITT